MEKCWDRERFRCRFGFAHRHRRHWASMKVVYQHYFDESHRLVQSRPVSPPRAGDPYSAGCASHSHSCHPTLTNRAVHNCCDYCTRAELMDSDWGGESLHLAATAVENVTGCDVAGPRGYGAGKLGSSASAVLGQAGICLWVVGEPSGHASSPGVDGYLACWPCRLACRSYSTHDQQPNSITSMSSFRAVPREGEVEDCHHRRLH